MHICGLLTTENFSRKSVLMNDNYEENYDFLLYNVVLNKYQYVRSARLCFVYYCLFVMYSYAYTVPLLYQLDCLTLSLLVEPFVIC